MGVPDRSDPVIPKLTSFRARCKIEEQAVSNYSLPGARLGPTVAAGYLCRSFLLANRLWIMDAASISLQLTA